MGTYNVTNLKDLTDKLIQKGKRIDSMLASTVNATATFVRNRSTEVITSRVLLQPNYVKQYLKVSKRASPNDPVAVISANERATLLPRYPHITGKDGVKVRINVGSGYETIRGSFIIKGLRGSGVTGIAMRNSVFYEYYKTLIHDTPGKQAKLKRAESRAKNKPKGITVLHSRSINQLFLSVREDVQPDLRRFMVEDFKKRLAND